MRQVDEASSGTIDFAFNQEPRCPCVLVLDTSSTMQGRKLAALNDGLQTFARELRLDAAARKRVELAIVTFGPVEVLKTFALADSLSAPSLTAGKDRPLGAALAEALKLIAARVAAYEAHQIAYYRPWIFLVSDGGPSDDATEAATAIRDGEASKSLAFYAVSVEGAGSTDLARIGVRQPLALRKLAFRKLFAWLADGLSRRCKSRPGEPVQLVNPTGPNGWAVG